MKNMDGLIDVLARGSLAVDEDEENIPILVTLPRDLVVSFGIIAENQGKTIDDFVQEAIRSKAAYYISKNATGVWRNGDYIPNRTPLEIENAARRGEKLREERVPCKVVGEITISGEPYYQILLNDNFVAVPKAQVIVYENESLFDVI